MEYFFLSLCLVAFWIGGSYGEVEFNVTQDPDVVNIGEVVTVKCIAIVSEGVKIIDNEGIKWRFGNNTEIRSGGYSNVTIGNTEKQGEENKLSVLTMAAIGDYWPDVKCGMTYEGADGNPTSRYSGINRIRLNVSTSVQIPLRSVSIEQGGQVNLLCAVEGSYVPLDNPWSDSKGPFKPADDVALSRIPQTTTSGVVVWIVQFFSISPQHYGNYTFLVPGMEAISASITERLPIDNTTPSPTSPSPTDPSTETSQLFSLKDIHNRLVNVTCSSAVFSGAESALAKVHFEDIFNVTCRADFAAKDNVKLVNDYPLCHWVDDEHVGDPLDKGHGVVTNTLVNKESNISASRILQLQASVISGTKWPKPFKCFAKVRLPNGDEFMRNTTTYRIDFDIPQNVKTIPEGVVVVDKDSPYHISCTVTGDMVPEVPWIHKEENMKDMNISGVTVTTERLQDTMGVISNVSFEKVTEHLVGDYVCHGGDGAGNVTVTLKLCNTSVITEPKDSEKVKLKKGSKYQIKCTITGDGAPTTNDARPWLDSDRKVITSEDGRKVTTTVLDNGNGIRSSISFASLTDERFGTYICHFKDKDSTVTLEPAIDETSSGNGSTEQGEDKTSNSGNGNGNDGQGEGHGSVGTTAIAIAVIVLLVLCGAVSLVYWKRQMLRDWLMDKDVVKVIKKQRRGKGYKYNKLPRDISTSMKHLE